MVHRLTACPSTNIHPECPVPLGLKGSGFQSHSSEWNITEGVHGVSHSWCYQPGHRQN